MSDKLKAPVYYKKTGEQIFFDSLAENTFMENGTSVEEKINSMNTEINNAKGSYSTLNNRLNGLDSQLEDIMINVVEKGIEVNSAEPQQNKINEILETYKGYNLFFPDGEYLIDDSIIVHSNTKLYFSENAKIVFKENTLVSQTDMNKHVGKHMIKNDLVDGLENIEIHGAKLYGNGYTQQRDGHRGMRFQNVKNLKLFDIELHEISGWSICYINLDNFYFENIYIDACLESLHGYNGDGISGSGKNGIINNVYGYSSDDLVSTHSGEDILDLNAPTENVIIKNVRALTKNGEKTHRAFAIYDNGTSYTKNIKIENVSGTCSQKCRIRNFARSEANGSFENISLNNIRLDNTSITIEYATIDRITLDNVEISNVDDVSVTNFIAIVNNSVVENLKLNNCVCDGVISNFFINDKVGISNIFISNCSFITTTSSAYIHFINSDSVTNTVNIYHNNINSNCKYLTGKNTNSTSLIYIKGGANENCNDVVLNDGRIVFDSITDEHFLIKDGKKVEFKQVIPSPLYISEGTSKNITVNYSLISISVGSDFNLNFVSKRLWSGISFYVSVTYSNSNVTFSLDDVPLFGGASVSIGTYLIVNLNGNFVKTKISDQPLANS